MLVELFLAKQCGSAKHDFNDASLYFTLRSVYCSGKRKQYAGLLVRQSHSFLVYMRSVIGPHFLAHYVPRNRTRTRYAQKVQG